MERNNGSTLAAACLARLVITESIYWTGVGLFSGAAYSELCPLWILLSAFCGMAVNHVLLRGRRNLLGMLVLNLFLAAAGALAAGWLCGMKPQTAELAAAWAAGTFLGLGCCFFSQIGWLTGRFKENRLMVQLQILLVLLAWQLWFSGQMNLSSRWPAYTVAMCVLLAAASVRDKISGLRVADETGWQNGRPAVLLVSSLLLASAAAGAFLLAQPVGLAVESSFDTAGAVFRTLLEIFVSVILFFYGGNRMQVDSSGTVSDAAGGLEILEQHSGGNADIFLFLFYGAVLALAGMLVWTFLQFLRRLAIGNIHRVSGQRNRRQKQNGSFLQQLRWMVQEIRQHWHARCVFRQNPSSIAALVVWLEARCSRQEVLCRKEGETLYQFLNRLADSVPEQEETSAALRNLAIQADQACYGREKNLLAAFAEADKIREFAKKV